MKKLSIVFFLLALTFISTTNGQDFSRLEVLSSNLRQQADDLVGRTAKVFKTKGLRSSNEIENAFVAEQLKASTILLQRIISERFHSSEIRYAGMVLHDLTERFPEEGPDSFEWTKAKDTVDEISRELRGLSSGIRIEKTGYDNDIGAFLGKVVWSGMVDADVLIKVRDRKIETRTIAGKTYPSGAYTFSNRLPDQNRIRVGVKMTHGRGKVHVIEQPSRYNDYTATIQIRDEDAGAKRYTLEIFWYRR